MGCIMLGLMYDLEKKKRNIVHLHHSVVAA